MFKINIIKNIVKFCNNIYNKAQYTVNKIFFLVFILLSLTMK